MNTFTNTKAAIKEYDLDTPRLRKLWDSVESNEDVYAAEKEEESALRKVRLAFFEDTKEINSWGSCSRVDIDFMRRMSKLNDNS